MAKYDFYLNYAEKDGIKIATTLEKLLTEKGFSVFGPEEYKKRTTFSKNSVQRFASKSWATITVHDAIKDCSCFVPIITNGFISTSTRITELTSVLNRAQDRAKKIIPIRFTDKSNKYTDFLLGPFQSIIAQDPAKLDSIAEQLSVVIDCDEKTALLYEKLLQFRKAGNDNRAAETVCEIAELSKKSYERLLSYCNVINATSIAGECIDRIAEIKTKLADVNEENCEDKRLEDSIKSLLGLTLRGSGNYDVFISFKSEDSDLGAKVYSFLSENLLEAFWSKVSLPQLSRSEYKKAIMNALDKSKHFVLVLSDLSYLSTDWIETETTIFDAEIKEGRKPDANFVFLVTDRLYDEIIAANKKNLPIEFRSYQILKMSNFRETLLDYVK